MRLFGNAPKPSNKLEEMLDEIVLHLDNIDGKKEPVRVADLMRGTMVMGATGSGKTSGSGKVYAGALLNKGYGGLVLCAKPDESIRWRHMAEAAGRAKDVIVFNEESGLQFNPIQYEKIRKGKGAGQTLNLVELIMVINLLIQNFTSSDGGSSDSFWENAMRRSVSRSIDLLKLANQDISVENIRKVIINALTESDVEKYKRLASDMSRGDDNAKRSAQAQIEDWRSRNFTLDCLIEAKVNHAKRGDVTLSEQTTCKHVSDYFFKEFARLAEKTRSSIEEYFFGLAEPFLSGLLHDQFGQGISPELMPEQTYLENKIIILDFPVKDYGLAGVCAQGMFKYAWQQAMERRKPEEDGNINPVFLWIDECQFFINPNYDSMFQTTARSALVASVYLTQTIHNLIFTMGRNNPEARAKGLLANMGTKIFHANADFDSNQFASNMIGQDITAMASMSAQLKHGQTATLSEQVLYQVPPHAFMTLKYGRKENDYMVEAYVVKTGPWAHTKKNYIKVAFPQNG